MLLLGNAFAPWRPLLGDHDAGEIACRKLSFAIAFPAHRGLELRVTGGTTLAR